MPRPWPHGRPRGPLVTVALVTVALLCGLGIGLAAGAARPGPIAHLLPAHPPAAAPPDDEPGGLAVFREGWRLIHQDALDRSALDDRRLVHGAMRGLVQGLGDPYASFQTPEERQVQLADFSGQLEGIGIYLEVRDGRLTVSAPIDEGPAARAGVRPGDAILAIDGQPADGVPLSEAVMRIRGPTGTGVHLTLDRPGAAAPIELVVERAEVRLISARGRMLEPRVGLIRLTRFHERTDEEVGVALEELGRHGARALVLDLRGNGGGLMGSASAVAGRFVPVSPIAWQEDGHGGRHAYDRPADQAAVDWPLVVLVDRGTASAAEVVAAALRDAGGARLVGQRTYGKGSVQYVRELGDGSGLTITAARLVSPAGTRLDQGGLTPDVAVDAPGTDAADPALDQALRLLRPLVPAW